MTEGSMAILAILGDLFGCDCGLGMELPTVLGRNVKLLSTV